MEFLERLLKSRDRMQESKGRAAVVTAFSKCVLRERMPRRVQRLLDLIAAEAQPWRQAALIEGFPQPTTKDRNPPRPIMLDAEPVALLKLRKTNQQLDRVFTMIHWPGEPGYVPPPQPRPLTTIEKTRYERGRQVYAQTCIQCHKANGEGQDGLAPSLVDSEWVLGPESRAIRIVLHGVAGPITVAGRTYALEMPGLPTLSDDDVAAVLTYVRRSWDNEGSPVEASEVKKVRERTQRIAPWTERELLRVR